STDRCHSHQWFSECSYGLTRSRTVEPYHAYRGLRPWQWYQRSDYGRLCFVDEDALRIRYWGRNTASPASTQLCAPATWPGHKWPALAVRYRLIVQCPGFSILAVSPSLPEKTRDNLHTATEASRETGHFSMANQPGIRSLTQASIHHPAWLLCYFNYRDWLLQSLVSTGACRQPAAGNRFRWSVRCSTRRCIRGKEL